ncbi:MAG: insulinase family protein [Alphaproteobacteria bacterium]|nr:insulinase family protein [Alphaproteobacteria bacterium]
MRKKIILIFLNLFFIGLAVSACLLFFKKNTSFDAQKIVNNSVLKDKTFETNIKEITLKDGLKAWYFEQKSAPIIALDFCFENAGYAFDEEQKEGISTLFASLLSEGAGNFPKQDFADLMEENAIEIDFDTSYDALFVSMTTPKDNALLAFDLLKAALDAPHFDQNHIDIKRTQQLTAIKMQNERPEKILAKTFKKKFFSSHPLGRSSLGDEKSLQNITRNDLIAYLKKHLTKDNLIISIVGDLSQDEAQNLLNDLFENLPEKSDIPPLPPATVSYSFDKENISRNIPQVLARFVAPGTLRLNDDFYALYIANEAFGGSGLNSRLNKIAREKEGLTYGAYTYLDTLKYAPSIQGSFATSKENYQKMLSILLQEWQKIADFGITQTEFEAVKSNMLTSFNLRFMSLSDISTQLLYMQKEHLGLDFLQKRNEYVKNTTLDEVNRAAKKYFSFKPSVLTIGNNELKGEN